MYAGKKTFRALLQLHIDGMIYPKGSIVELDWETARDFMVPGCTQSIELVGESDAAKFRDAPPGKR